MSERPAGDPAPPARRERTTRWQAEFPLHGDADDLVTRRELLRLSAWTSGALFAVTALLAALGLARDRRTVKVQRIASLSELPPGTAHYFSYPNPDNHAILLHLSTGSFVAYSGRCTHLSCAVYYDPASQRLRCPCHDGAFDPRTGEPLAGPPVRPLPKIALRQEGGVLYATAEAPA